MPRSINAFGERCWAGGKPSFSFVFGVVSASQLTSSPRIWHTYGRCEARSSLRCVSYWVQEGDQGVHAQRIHIGTLGWDAVLFFYACIARPSWLGMGRPAFCSSSRVSTRRGRCGQRRE